MAETKKTLDALVATLANIKDEQEKIAKKKEIYKNISSDDIINWCVENKQVEWLKEEAQKQIPHKIYPKVERNGKKKMDKTQEPIGETYKRITFVEMKLDFCDKFFPVLSPERQDKKESMFDRIMAL